MAAPGEVREQRCGAGQSEHAAAAPERARERVAPEGVRAEQRSVSRPVERQADALGRRMCREEWAEQRDEQHDGQQAEADRAGRGAREAEAAHRAGARRRGTSSTTSRSAMRFSPTTATAISSAIDWTARTSRIATESTSSLPRPG